MVRRAVLPVAQLTAYGSRHHSRLGSARPSELESRAWAAGTPHYTPGSLSEVPPTDAGFAAFGHPGLRFDRWRRFLGRLLRAAAAGMEPRAAPRAGAAGGQGRASQAADHGDHP